MSSLARAVACGTLICAASVAAAIAVAGPASAEFPGTEVTIVSPDGDQAFILLSQIELPENYGTYRVRDRAGTTTSVTVAKGNGISLRQILEEEDLDVGYGTIEIERPDGTTLELDKDDVDSARFSPTFYVDDAGQLWFLRPSTGPTDYNAADHFQIVDSAVRLTQTPAELEVDVEASRKRIEPGESVELTASVSGGPPDAEYTYDWDFGDGKRKDDGRRKVRHRFVEAGSYEVVVEVKVDDARRGESANVRIQVGDPKDSDEDREGGGENGGAGAPDSGATYTPSYTPPATSTPVPPTPTPTPAPTPTPKPLQPDVDTSGTTVEGNLLADVGDSSSGGALESAARAARDGKPRDDDGPDGAGVSEAAMSIAGVLALLGLGAGIETRQGRLPRLRLPRLALPRRGA